MYGEKKPAGRLSVAVIAPGGDDDSEAESVEDGYADAMWEAVKSDDKDGFKMALNDYVKACVEKTSEPDADTEE